MRPRDIPVAPQNFMDDDRLIVHNIVRAVNECELTPVCMRGKFPEKGLLAGQLFHVS